MAAPPLIDIPALLAPIPGDEPAGSSVPYEVRSRLEEARKDIDPNDFAPDDPMRPAEPVRADWAGIVRLAQETLTNTSKDLLVCARLTEALVKLHGFAGLRDGLRLTRELVEQCWDRLNPPIEDGDVEVRAAPFHWLDDPDRGARFPNTLRQVPLIGQPATYSFLDFKLFQEGRGRMTKEEFDQAIAETPPERLQADAAALRESLDEISRLTQALAARMETHAPGLIAMRQAVESSAQFVQEVLRIKGGGAAAPAAPAAGSGTAAAPAAAVVPVAAAGMIATRAEAYRQLAEAAALLQRLEPHSPIPYLVQRAVQLGNLSFPELLRALVREPNVLAELTRELGLPSDSG